jgi:phosphoheptose isomerase
MIKFPNNKKYRDSKSFFKDYSIALKDTLLRMDYQKLDKIYEILNKTIKKRGQIFVAGNGGAASVSNHFLCDFNKGVKISSEKKLMPKVISLSSSIETITAISNDLSYEKIFSFQLENYIQKNDCLFVMSCSGTSKNILNVIKFCKKKNIKIIYVTGFLKKKPNYKVDVHLNLNCKNYGITEDIFSSIMHMISQFIRQDSSKKINQTL